ncbi:unnamed protein product, partial [Angiostrongylus costaricensis]|uniref:Autophagy-related protein 9 n=1 Tax=Angiostrongylus costaricensis TaxID=334426 RepID=A0A0R3PAR8_ANGCS
KCQEKRQYWSSRISGSSTPGDGYHSPPLNHVVGDSRHDESGLNPAPAVMSSSSRRNNHRWDHIEDPDRFFTLVYEYHQGGGFLTIALKKMLSLAQFVFVVTFSTFFTQCVDYDVLFANKNVTSMGDKITGKRSFNDAVIRNCSSHLHPFVVFSILVAIIFWISRVVKTTYYLLQLHEIQLFYRSELRIDDAQLSNLTWHAVVKRICEVQKRLQLIVDREHVTPIDLYNRILRFKNYLVALVNTVKSMCLLLDLSTSPWTGPYLKAEYKDLDNLEALTRQMEKDVSTSDFSIVLILHTIRLNHELAARLNRSHIFANAYLNQFYSTLTEIFAKNIAFIAGAIAGVLTILSAWDEDVLQVEHVLTVISICGIIIVVCHGLISDENLVWQPEVLLTNVASELHYVPSEWKGKAHTDKVRREFEQLFQLKWVFLVHELTSPILTPFVLLFWIRPNCRELVRFFHDNTVRVEGLGDVCSFALMDVAKHGDEKWNGSGLNPTSIPACDGKTELSVLHFASTNPEWKPPLASAQFLQRFKTRVSVSAHFLFRGGIVP